MKTARKLMVNLILLFLLSPAYAGEAVYRLQVDGLACPFCSYGIEKQLRSIDGVANVEVNISKGSVLVTMQQNISLDEKRTRQAVKDAGFTLRSFKQLNEGNSDVSDR